MLQPHLADIVNHCLILSMKSEEPTNYLQILRLLFRSINGVKNDVLYREFQPLLQPLLIGLNKLMVCRA